MINDSEEWRAIEGAPDYEVSDHGRVRRTTRGRNTMAGRVLRPVQVGKYLVVTLRRHGKRKGLLVHRLVAEAFVGAPPTSGLHVAHGFGDPTYNAAHQLRWATPVENNADKKEHGTHLQGERCGSARLKPRQVLEIRNWSAFVSAKSIGRVYGVSDSTVLDIIHGRSWSHLKGICYVDVY